MALRRFTGRLTRIRPPAQRSAAMPPARPLPTGPHGPWWEQPPSPRARCGVAASVFSHPRHRLRGCSRTRDPLREGHARRRERVGLTGAATSDSAPERPMGTANPPWHGDHGECVAHLGDRLRSANPVGSAELSGVEGVAPRQPRRGHAECGPSQYAAEPPWWLSQLGGRPRFGRRRRLPCGRSSQARSGAAGLATSAASKARSAEFRTGWTGSEAARPTR